MAEPAPDSFAAGAAMRQAVDAERDARREIAEAEAQAKADVEAARAEARALLNAVPARISRLRTRGESAVHKALARIRAEETAAAQHLNEAVLQPMIVEDTVREVARFVTGAAEVSDAGRVPP